MKWQCEYLVVLLFVYPNRKHPSALYIQDLESNNVIYFSSVHVPSHPCCKLLLRVIQDKKFSDCGDKLIGI